MKTMIQYVYQRQRQHDESVGGRVRERGNYKVNGGVAITDTRVIHMGVAITDTRVIHME